eukprot:1156027-Pelagomonas_calceolata.AAC.9
MCAEEDPSGSVVDMCMRTCACTHTHTHARTHTHTGHPHGPPGLVVPQPARGVCPSSCTAGSCAALLRCPRGAALSLCAFFVKDMKRHL